MKVNKKTKQILAIAILLTLILFLANFFLFFYLTKMQKDLQEIKKVLAEKDTKIGNLVALKNNIVETQEEREKIDSYFIKGEEETALLLEELEALSEHLNLALTIDLETGGRVFKEGGETRKILTISIETQGTFQKLVQLLFLVENLPYKISLSQVALERRRESDTKDKIPEWTLSLKFDIVSYLPEAP